MQCQCIKKDGMQCTASAKVGKYCGRHQACKSPVKSTRTARCARTTKSVTPLKQLKRYPKTKVLAFIENFKKKQGHRLDKITLRKTREKAEKEIGVDFTNNVEFRQRFKQDLLSRLSA